VEFCAGGRQEITGRLWTHVVGNTFIVLLAYYLN